MWPYAVVPWGPAHTEAAEKQTAGNEALCHDTPHPHLSILFQQLGAPLLQLRAFPLGRVCALRCQLQLLFSPLLLCRRRRRLVVERGKARLGVVERALRLKLRVGGCGGLLPLVFHFLQAQIGQSQLPLGNVAHASTEVPSMH